MESVDQRWYDTLRQDRDLHFDLRQSAMSAQLPDQYTNIRAATSYLDYDLAVNTYPVLDLPPSLMAAAESYEAISPYSSVAYKDFEGVMAEADDPYDGVAVTVPFSFSHRSLQLALLQTSNEAGEVAEVSYADASSSMNRVDSARGSLDAPVAFRQVSDSTEPTFDSNEYAEISTMGQNDECPLQYHLIKMKSRAELKEDSVAVPNTQRSLGAAVQSSANDTRVLSCHLCPDKHYTGAWAHRNLSRHMESTHMPSPSPDGAKQIRCSHQSCDKTFNRKDARLVHERKSHPDLNRSPPTKRKRSEDL